VLLPFKLLHVGGADRIKNDPRTTLKMPHCRKQGTFVPVQSSSDRDFYSSAVSSISGRQERPPCDNFIPGSETCYPTPGTNQDQLKPDTSTPLLSSLAYLPHPQHVLVSFGC
jgi:hypothetical protein